jgi:hypothetical protein
MKKDILQDRLDLGTRILSAVMYGLSMEDRSKFYKDHAAYCNRMHCACEGELEFDRKMKAMRVETEPEHTDSWDRLIKDKKLRKEEERN